VQCLRDAVEFILEYHRASSYLGYADILAANDDACHGGFSYHSPHFFYLLPIPASSLPSNYLFFRGPVSRLLKFQQPDKLQVSLTKPPKKR
jgi:hypothetical protein